MLNQSVTNSDPFSQAGASNTRLDSQDLLSSQIDYSTITFTQTNSQAFNATLRALALYLLPCPVDNWTTVKKSKNPSVQYAQYQRHKEKFKKDCQEHSRLVDIAIALLPDKPYKICDAKYYPSRLETILPLTGGYGIDSEMDGQVTATLRISGEFWSAIALSDQASLLQFLSKLPNVKCSRIDVALDDFSKEIIPYDSMLAACYARQFSGFREGTEIGNFGLKEGVRKGTINMGSRNSSNFYRCYWKPDRLRLEREIKQKEANANFWHLVECSLLPLKTFGRMLAKLAIGSIDFVERVTPDTSVREKNIARCDRFPWWQSLIDKIGEGVRLKIAEPLHPVQDSLNWVDKAVFATLTAFRNGMGAEQYDNWHYAGLRSKQGNQSSRHQQITEYLRARKLSYG